MFDGVSGSGVGRRFDAAGGAGGAHGQAAAGYRASGGTERRDHAGVGGIRYIITSSGSYYLTGSAGVFAEPLIDVNPTARDVTIDLMGFTVSTQFLGSLIETDEGFIGTLTVRNGAVRGSGNQSGRTIRLGSVQAAVTCEDLRIENARDGLALGDNAVLRRCTVRVASGTPGAAGIEAGSGSLVESCVVRDIDQTGSSAGIRVGANSVVRGCSVLQNGSVAFGIDAGSGGIVENNVVRCDANPVPFTAIRTGGAGIVRGNIVTAAAAVLDVTGVSGATGATICDNTFSSCDVGVALGTNSGCLVVRNHIRNSVTAVQANFPASNIIGPTVGPGGAAASSNPHANDAQ